MAIEYPSASWEDYELIDSGNFEKLERFGPYVMSRPEPKALWGKTMSDQEWNRAIHTRFRPGAGFGKAGKEDSGTWERMRRMDDQWYIRYVGYGCAAGGIVPGTAAVGTPSGTDFVPSAAGGTPSGADSVLSEAAAIPSGADAVPFEAAAIHSGTGSVPSETTAVSSGAGFAPSQTDTIPAGSFGGKRKGPSFSLRLGLTSFKHVGVFPEQAPNWEFIYFNTRRLVEKAKAEGRPAPKVLNLFAYTGAASLAAKAAGADVTHLDSVRQVVTWARGNMERSRLDGIRWLVEDAMKFARREAKRGNLYQGIILDPPAYGHGPDGEKWKLDECLYDILKCVAAILAPQDSFMVLNLYSNGYSAMLGETLVREAFGLHGASVDRRDAAREDGSRPRRHAEPQTEPASSPEITSGELCLKDRFGKILPLSIYVRLKR